MSNEYLYCKVTIFIFISKIKFNQFYFSLKLPDFVKTTNCFESKYVLYEH